MKKSLLLLFAFAFAFNTTVSAQKEGKKVKEEKVKEEKEIIAKRSLIFTKYQSAWQVGVFGGASILIGDVKPSFLYGGKPLLPGHNFGIFVSKSWTYLFSTRLKYSNMVMFTNAAVPSTLTSNQYNYLKARSSGLPGYSPGDLIFHNSRTQAHDVTLDLVFSLGNINFNKERSVAVFKFFPTVGALMYQTFYDHLDANGNPYDYKSVDNLNKLNTTSRKDVYKALASMRDGKYETRAEEHAVEDENKWNKYNGRLTYGFGAGVAFRLTKWMSLDIESRQMFLKDDLLDGVQWQEPGGNNAASRGLTNGFDTYNQTTVGLTFSIMTKNMAESKNMDNPLAGDAFSKKKNAEDDKPKASTNEELDSANVVLQEKIDSLQGQLNEIGALVKMLADKEKERLEKEKAEAEAAGLEPNDAGVGANANDPSSKGNAFKHRNGDDMFTAKLQGDLDADYYLIIGSFRVKTNAVKDQKNWASKGINTVIMFDVTEGLNRLVVDFTDDHATALDMLDEYRATLNKDIWIIKSK